MYGDDGVIVCVKEDLPASSDQSPSRPIDVKFVHETLSISESGARGSSLVFVDLVRRSSKIVKTRDSCSVNASP
jgi:hypothetical protein